MNSNDRITEDGVGLLMRTSLQFMFDWVPEPVWKMTSGKCSSSFPSITSSAAAQIASLTSGESFPRAKLYWAMHFFTTPNA